MLRVTGVLKREAGGLGKGAAFLIASIAALSKLLFLELLIIFKFDMLPSSVSTN